MLNPGLIAVVFLALFFDYINGMHDTANAIATSVSTRVLSLKTAIIMAASFNFVGALISTKVASTIGKGIIDPNLVTQDLVAAALLGAIIWNLITWYFGLPSSSSHALIGGVVGAGLVKYGSGQLNFGGLEKIVASLVISPILGVVAGYLIMTLLYWLLRRMTPSRVTSVFGKLQVASAGLMAFSHGSNDAQKSMGIISMALYSAGAISTFHIPLWVVLACAGAMALGTSAGGLRIIKTMGHKIIKLQPVHGFAAEAGASVVILGATHLGLPVSTTHVIASTIMGVGASKRLKAVNWSLAGNIGAAWILTIPASALMAALILKVISLF